MNQPHSQISLFYFYGMFFLRSHLILYTFNVSLVSHMKSIVRKIISASRRQDMVAFFPDKLIDLLERRCPPEKVHSLVLWTKDPRNMWQFRALNQKLQQYDQIYVHYTITGMGGTCFEPGIPKMVTGLENIGNLLDYLKNPRLLHIRFDPIVNVRMSEGDCYTNLFCFSPVAKVCRQYQLHEITISWMQLYDKVRRRLSQLGLEAIELKKSEQAKQQDWIMEQARQYDIQLHGCCVETLPESSCIDGNLLNALHPNQEMTLIKKSSGQRQRCGCNASWDIGWYEPCGGSCIYCYARPKELKTLVGERPKKGEWIDQN